MSGKPLKKRKPYNRVLMNVATDYTVLFIVMFLVVFGIIMVYSSSFYSARGAGLLSEPYIKQIVFALIGFVVMWVISRLQLSFINRFAAVGYIVTISLLIIVLFIADDINGAKRWIPMGGFNLQPSEIAKFTVIIVLAFLLTNMKHHLQKVRAIVLVFLLIVVPIGLTAIEDLSSAIVVIAISGAMIFVAYRDTIKVIFLGVFLAFIGSGFVLLNSYRIERIKTYLDGPWSDPEGAGRQIIQSLYAIGSGGLTGIGLGQSMQKMGYISEAHNDIIFAIICEELGLLGGVAIMGLYVLLIYRIAQISFNAKSMNHFLIGIGVMTHIAIQAFINVAVAINLIPTTGLPLPFISYGGSSIIMFLVEIGLVLNISRHNRVEKYLGDDAYE